MYLLNVLTQLNVYLLDRTFYYFSNDEVLAGVRVKIKFHNKEMIGYVLSSEYKSETKEQIEDNLGININFIEEVIDDKPILSENLLKLAKELKKRYIYPLIGVLQTILPPSLKPKSTFYNAAKISYVYYYKINDLVLNKLDLTSNEKKIIDKFNGKKVILKKDLNSTKSLDNLIAKGAIELVKEEKNRYKLNVLFSDYENEIILNNEQEIAYENILNSTNNTCLLYGVTGSGKTEIYIKLIQQYREENKGAIVLVPEIALTPLMISRLYNIFKDEIAVIHSSLTSGEIYDEYRKIASKKAKIVIGTRSAIFAPVDNLGLIIIDEENDECYKQDDQGLLYNAKEVAQIRSKIEGCKIILGSATPSIEDMAKAKNGLYQFVEIKNRYNSIPLPDVFLIDNKNYKNYSVKSNVFSLELIKQLKICLMEGKQSILFINRRGYSNYVICRECGYTFKCPKCNLPLHYHKEKKVLYCHHCEYKIPLPKKCPNCDSPYLGYGQFGIEKVEEDFKRLFPNIKYLVLDSDRTNKTFQIEEVLNSFNNKEASVLIGTQIVAKGHDFSNVKVVGVLNADILLNFPNYRSNEMTFSLLTQVIGRCGRKSDKGVAIIQSSQASNYSIVFATQQNYDAFYQEEIKNRKLFNNPPFSSILAIEISTKNLANLDDFVKKIKNYFISLNLDNVEIYGPSLLSRKGNTYRKHIFIKYKKLVDLIEHIESLLDVYKNEQKINIKLNFNPYTF